MQTRESKRNKPAAITVAGFVAIIVSIAALLIMFTLPRPLNTIKIIHEEVWVSQGPE